MTNILEFKRTNHRKRLERLQEAIDNVYEALDGIFEELCNVEEVAENLEAAYNQVIDEFGAVIGFENIEEDLLMYYTGDKE
jgi:hypothetical protein